MLQRNTDCLVWTMKSFTVCVFLWTFLFVASSLCSSSTSDVSLTLAPTTPTKIWASASSPKHSLNVNSSSDTSTASVPDVSTSNYTQMTPTSSGNSTPSTNTSSPLASFPFSLLSMQNKIPGGMGSSLLPFLIGGGSIDMNTITDLLKTLGPQLPSILKGLLRSNTSGLTEDERMCSEDVDTFLADLVVGKMWALTMIDASGKPGTSLFKGATTFFGNYDECLEVVSEVDISNGRQVKGDTCVVSIKPPKQLLAMMGPGSALAPNLGINWHLCLPRTCGSGKVKSDLQSMLSNVNLTIDKVVCHAEIKNGPISEDSEAVGAIVLTAILGCMVLLGSALDMYIRGTKDHCEKAPVTPGLDAVQLEKISAHLQSKDTEGIEKQVSNGHKDNLIDNRQGTGHVENGALDNPAGPTLPEANGGHFRYPNGAQPPTSEENPKKQKPKLWQRILLCFSAVSNGEKILSVKRSPASISCLNGIRVLSMSWVILGHTFLNLITNVENGADLLPITKSFSFQVIMNGTLSVDTFFFLSGLLVTYLFLKETEKAGGLKVKHMVMYYVHRYLRLTPVYAYVIFVYTFVVPYLVDGPTWTSPTDKASCENNWWINMLYINNLLRADQMCIAWSWYLANDMQFYFVAPVVLIPLALSLQVKNTFARKVLKLTGICVALACIIIGIACTGYYSYHNFQDITGVFLHVYIKPWCRIGPFAIGMLVGYLIQTKKSEIKISPFMQGLGWVLAVAVAGLCTLLTYDDTKGPGWGIDGRTAFDTLFRPVWALVLAWVVFMCCKGKGGIVDWMLSWDWWQPLSRLTYGAYLVHLVLMITETLSMRSLIYYTQGYVVYRFFGFVCMSFIVSFMMAILVEAPLLQLEKLVLS
ncbi:O-acyltransferase like protein-like [Haliotis asinina]|uniref:O-acyltransferase like protein-like n=1 Tax=Haliotis asinina TaxID=109174 RepID=UPI0035323B4D